MHNKLNLKKELTDAWHIALLKKAVMHSVAGDKEKTVFGFYVIIASAILSFVGMQFFAGFFSYTLSMSLVMGVIQLVGMIVGIYVLSFVAQKIFKGHAKHDEFFRVAAYGMIVTWLGLIPQLNIIGSIWALVILFVALKAVHKLTTGGVIGTLLVSFVIMMIVSAVLSPLYARVGFGGFMNGGVKYKGMDTIMDTSGMKLDTGNSKVEFGGDSMKITTEEGKTIEWKITDDGQ